MIPKSAKRLFGKDHTQQKDEVVIEDSDHDLEFGCENGGALPRRQT